MRRIGLVMIGQARKSSTCTPPPALSEIKQTAIVGRSAQIGSQVTIHDHLPFIINVRGTDRL